MYGGPPQQSYGMQQAQANPYSGGSGQEPEQTNDDGSDAGPDKVGDAKGEFNFEPEFDSAADLKLRTACCCCVCAFDDCDEWMRVQQMCTLLCIKNACNIMLFQCMDQSNRACCKLTAKQNLLDFSDEEKGGSCYFMGCRGVFCLCCSGKMMESCCDPCQMPDTCCESMSQCLFIHLRAALPCNDEYAPFEIAVCGISCFGGPEEKSEAHE